MALRRGLAIAVSCLMVLSMAVAGVLIASPTALACHPELRVEKEITGWEDVDGSGDYSPGDKLTYTIGYENTVWSGARPAEDVYLRDNFEESKVSVIWISDDGYLVTPGGDSQIHWEIGYLDVGEGGTRSFQVELDGEFPLGNSRLYNQVLVKDRASGQSDAYCMYSCVHNPPNPQIQLIKDGPAKAQVGDTITYYFTVTNTGNLPLFNINIDDTTLGIVDLPVPELDPGESTATPLEATYTIDGGDPDPLPNVAQVCGQYDLSKCHVCAQDDHEVDIVHPALSIEKTGPDSVEIGDTVEYTIEVTNDGDVTLHNVVVEDTKLGLSYNVPVDLAPGDSYTLPAGTAVYGPVTEDDLPGPIQNTAKATSDETPDPVDDSCEVDVTQDVVVPSPGLEVTKEGPGTAKPGDTITYTITITNTGNVDLNDVSFTDDIPENTEIVAGSVSSSDAGASINSEDPVSISGISISVGGSVTINFSVSIDEDVADGTIIRNQGITRYPGGEEPSDDPSTPEDDDPTDTIVNKVGQEEKILGSTEWFLAEGATAEGFDTWILLQNPQTEEANVEVTFMTQEGARDPINVVLPAQSRTNVRISEFVPSDFHVSTMVESDIPVVAERSMYWHKEGGELQPFEMKSGHANLGTTLESLSAQGSGSGEYNAAYFPEGATAGGFNTWILLCNTNREAASVQVNFATTEGLAASDTIEVPPLSRRTVHLNEHVPDAFEVATEVESDLPIVAERSMYWDENMRELQPYQTQGGHSNSGSFFPAKDWFLAEGSTGLGFETYVLIQNPQDVDAEVTATFMNEDGVAAEERLSMVPHSRATLKVSDYVPNDFHVSTKVTSNREIIAERSMYWDKRVVSEGYKMRDGHSTVGISSLGKTWMVPEGSTGVGFESFVLLSNPGANEANATVTFMTREGPATPFVVTIPAESRRTIRVIEHIPNEFFIATFVDCDTEIAVERAMYWDRREREGIQPYEMLGGHSAGGIDP